MGILMPKGFTIIELIIVMVIIGILAVMTIPRLINVGAISANESAHMVAADIRKTQELAMADTVSHQIQFTSGSSSYVIDPSNRQSPNHYPSPGCYHRHNTHYHLRHRWRPRECRYHDQCRWGLGLGNQRNRQGDGQRRLPARDAEDEGIEKKSLIKPQKIQVSWKKPFWIHPDRDHDLYRPGRHRFSSAFRPLCYLGFEKQYTGDRGQCRFPGGRAIGTTSARCLMGLSSTRPALP